MISHQCAATTEIINTIASDQAVRAACSATGACGDRMTILALDLGTTTGWALCTGSGPVVSGTMTFSPNRYEGGGMRYLRFRSWLDEMLDEIREQSAPRAVYFEEVRHHTGTDAAHVYGGFLAHLTAWCEQHNMPYQGVPVGTIKRYATGKGNASKLAVLTAIRARGFSPVDDNEADAIAIMLWAWEQLDPRYAYPSGQGRRVQ